MVKWSLRITFPSRKTWTIMKLKVLLADSTQTNVKKARKIVRKQQEKDDQNTMMHIDCDFNTGVVIIWVYRSVGFSRWISPSWLESSLSTSRIGIMPLSWSGYSTSVFLTSYTFSVRNIIFRKAAALRKRSTFFDLRRSSSDFEGEICDST